MNSKALYKMIGEKFCTPAWVIFPEVSNSTGSQLRRYADAVAMSIWPSRGFEIHGFEIKVSRSDWISELKNPKKSSEVQKYCDKWWIVAGDDKIVMTDELPPTWGLLVPSKNKLMCKVSAPQLEAVGLDKSFMASILRRCFEQQSEIRNAGYAEGYEDSKKNGPEDQRRKIDELSRDIGFLQKKISEFEKASGVTLDGWSAGNVGKAVAFVRKAMSIDSDLELMGLIARVKHFQEVLKMEVDVFKEIKKLKEKTEQIS